MQNAVSRLLRNKSLAFYKRLRLAFMGIEFIAVNGDKNHAQLLQLSEVKQTWTFKDYHQKPVLALLTGFSAPVKTKFEQ